MGDYEYIGKGGIIIDIFDSDNSPTDKYDENDCFCDENEEYKKVTAESTIGIPRFRETSPERQEPPKKQIIKKHIAHDQEVEILKRNYAISLEEIPLIPYKKAITSYTKPRIFLKLYLN